jgi:signal transduction histidine kinase
MKSNRFVQSVTRYGIAIGGAGLAAVLRVALDPVMSPHVTLIMFYPAIMIAAWHGGLGPGVVATVLSAGLVDYLWFAPVGSLAIASVADAVTVGLFIAMGLVISGLNEGLRRALRQAHCAQVQAEAANRAKDEFIARVSHELRTPLNSVMGWARMLSEGHLPPDRVHRAIAAIDENADVLRTLVEDLVETSRLATGKLSLRRQAVDLTSIGRDAAAVIQHSASDKGLRFDVDVPPEPLMVDGDPTRLRQIVWNLLSNAVKFTPSGGLISLRLERLDQRVDVVVADTGPGIASEFLPHVFEPFAQASRDGQGLGLGLAIVDQLVRAHGGTISVVSTSGGGTTFTIALPLVHVTAAVDILSAGVP